MNNNTGTKATLKKRIACKGCHKVFNNKEKKININCPYCDKSIDARIRTGYAREYARKHPDRKIGMIKYDNKYKKERGKVSRDRVRKTNFNIISNNNPVCANCGCDDIRLLEINHINGGGNKELLKGKGSNSFAWDIYMGRRKTDDLNLLCRPCNALDHLERIFGEIPIRILWR